MRGILIAVVIAACLFFSYAPPARASCEVGEAVDQSELWQNVKQVAAIMARVARFIEWALETFLKRIFEMIMRFMQMLFNIMDFFEGMTTDITGDLRAMLRGINLNFPNFSLSMGIFEDGIGINDWLGKIGDIEFSNSRNFRLPGGFTCTAATASSAFGRAEKFGEGLMAAFANKTTDAVLLTEDPDNPEYNPRARGRVGYLQSARSSYIQDFCDPNDNSGNNFANCAGTNPNADVKTTEFFSQSTIDVRDKDTLKASSRMLEHLVLPPPRNKVLRQRDFSDTVDGMNKFVNERSMATRTNMAATVVSDMIARRTPGSGLKGWVEEMRADLGMPALSADDTHDPSYNELMEMMTKNRFKSINSYLKMEDEPENVMKEQMINKVFQAMQAHDEYEMMEKTLWMIATELAMELEELDPKAPEGLPQQ